VNVAKADIHDSAGTLATSRETRCGTSPAKIAGLSNPRHGRIHASNPPTTTAPTTKAIGLRWMMGRRKVFDASAATRLATRIGCWLQPALHRVDHHSDTGNALQGVQPRWRFIGRLLVRALRSGRIDSRSRLP
jgi:hypothetical protein